MPVSPSNSMAAGYGAAAYNFRARTTSGWPSTSSRVRGRYLTARFSMLSVLSLVGCECLSKCLNLRQEFAGNCREVKGLIVAAVVSQDTLNRVNGIPAAPQVTDH